MQAKTTRVAGRRLAITIALAAMACEGDSTVAADHDPNEDQALKLAVMGARGDTLTAAVDNEVIVDTTLPPDLRPVTRRPPPHVAAAPALSPAVVQAPRPAPPQQITRPSTVVQERAPAPPPRVAAAAPEPAPVRRPAREKSNEEPLRRTGLIARGSTLSVVTSRPVCNDAASVGNTVRGELTSSLRGTNGVAIPEGAQVVAEITSIDKWGAGVGMQVTSVRVDGRSYPVRSRTEYVLPKGSDRGTCILEGTRLTVETKDAISVAALR